MNAMAYAAVTFLDVLFAQTLFGQIGEIGIRHVGNKENFDRN